MVGEEGKRSRSVCISYWGTSEDKLFPIESYNIEGMKVSLINSLSPTVASSCWLNTHMHISGKEHPAPPPPFY